MLVPELARFEILAGDLVRRFCAHCPLVFRSRSDSALSNLERQGHVTRVAPGLSGLVLIPIGEAWV